MAAIIAKGDASISINPEETQATLGFVFDPDGLGWDADAVIKLAGENKLGAPQARDLETFLKGASKAKKKGEVFQMVIARGTPPEDPAGEEISWEAVPVPADMEPYKDTALKEAGDPVLYRVKTERIKKEQLVKKAGALPFLPGKEEMVVTWEKKETREKVSVNPELKELKYAEKGKKIGTASPPKPGKPGKSVFGKPIPPKQLPEGGFLLGKGLSREKNDIYAQYSGLLRIGENWADVAALAKPSWAVEKGSDGITFYFRFEPGDSRFAPPTGEEVIADACSKGAPAALLVKAESIDAEIAGAIHSGAAVFAHSLFRVQEGEAVVEISPDRTMAALNLRKGVAGGRPLSMKDISQALRDSKVQGFDQEKLKADLKTFMEGPELALDNYLLVEGKPSTRGKDREVQLTVKLPEEAETKPILERVKARSAPLVGEENFPPEEANGAVMVKKGDTVARISAGSEGESGKDIFGNEIPGLPGNDPDLKLYGGLEQHGSDITAAMDGLLLVKTGEKSFRGQVIEYRDGRVAVHVSDDAMEARVDLVKEQGAGLALRPDLVLKALAAMGVLKGVNTAAVEAACKQAHARGSCEGALVARGKVPLAKDGFELTWLVPGGGPGPGKSIPVKAGQPVAELRPGPEGGRPGYNVKGAVLEIDKAVPLDLNHDESIKEVPAAERQGGEFVRLTAACLGELCFDGKRLTVSSLQGVEGDVGPATGNIRFSGEVRIKGRVLPGFTVTGGLNVLISGSADAALISAGGKVLVAGGIRGAGKGLVRSRKTVEAAFVDQATVMAIEDIRLKSGCLKSNIKTNGMLLIDDASGRLEGGVTKARKGVNAQDVGNEKGNRTEISFGQDYLIRDQIDALDNDIEKIRAAIKRLDIRIQQVLKNPQALSAARAEKVKLMKMLEQLNIKIFTLREKYEEHFDSEIRIRGTVYPGVVMESHDRYYEVSQARSGVVFYFDRDIGRIKERGM
ncbi:MAG: FapA family protein [Treponema sp.]|jgi:uncharacterized protein (DUF342 family)|nr:FapA family protein [Treponema sp.]